MIQVTSRGGALYTARSSLTISACNFTNNAAAFGGAIYASHAQVSDASFLGNKSNGGMGRGRTDDDPPGNGSDGGKGGAVSLINKELLLRPCRRDIAYIQAVRFLPSTYCSPSGSGSSTVVSIPPRSKTSEDDAA